MTILAMVNAEQEGHIESKLQKARQLEEIREAKRKEAEARHAEKKNKLVCVDICIIVYIGKILAGLGSAWRHRLTGTSEYRKKRNNQFARSGSARAAAMKTLNPILRRPNQIQSQKERGRVFLLLECSMYKSLFYLYQFYVSRWGYLAFPQVYVLPESDTNGHCIPTFPTRPEVCIYVPLLHHLHGQFAPHRVKVRFGRRVCIFVQVKVVRNMTRKLLRMLNYEWRPEVNLLRHGVQEVCHLSQRSVEAYGVCSKIHTGFTNHLSPPSSNQPR